MKYPLHDPWEPILPSNPSVIGLRSAILRQAFDLIAGGTREVSTRVISNCVSHCAGSDLKPSPHDLLFSTAVALADLRLQFRRSSASDRSAVGTEREPKVSGKAETITPDSTRCRATAAKSILLAPFRCRSRKAGALNPRPSRAAATPRR